MNIGDQVKFRPKYKATPVCGRIIWIHPQQRFVLVEFRVLSFFGMSPALRECLQGVNGRIVTRNPKAEELRKK